MKSRELRLIAIGLGGLALVLGARASDTGPQHAVTIEGVEQEADVAVVGGESEAQTGSAAEGESGELADQLSTVVADRSIRLLDFGAIDQPVDACAEGVRDELEGQLDVIALDGGTSGIIDDVNLAQLVVDEEVAYGDISGSGLDEAVVHTVCEFGASGREHHVQVWDLSEGLAELVGTVPPPGPEVTGPLSTDVLRFGVQGDTLEVVWSSYAEDDPNCCPSGESTIRYRVVDGEVTQVGEPETVEAP